MNDLPARTANDIYTYYLSSIRYVYLSMGGATGAADVRLIPRTERKMDLLDMAGHLIRRMHQQSTQVFIQRTQAAGFDLTSVQFAALDAIHSHPATDQARVAEMIAYDRATIGGVIDRLEQKGWIRRVVSERDRRSRELSLTREGERVRSALLPIVRDLQDEILEPLSGADRARFLMLARRVVRQQEAANDPRPVSRSAPR